MEIKYSYEAVFMISVLLSAVSQVILKKSASRQYSNKVYEYLNPCVLGAYSLFFLSTLLTVLAYKEVPLSKGQILEAGGYIYVTVLGMIFLKERPNRKKVSGIILILTGIVIFSYEK